MKKSVTLTEILVGTLILAMVFGGLLATFVSVRRYVKRANRRLVAHNIVRRVLNNLPPYVREDEWDSTSSPLYGTGTSWRDHDFSEINLTAPVTIDNQEYTGDYQVREKTGYQYREVIVNLDYPTD